MDTPIRIPKSYYFPFLVTTLVLVFTAKVTEIVNTVLVKPFFSSVQKSTPVIDVVTVLLAVIILLSFVIRAFQGVRISPLLVLYIVASCGCFFFINAQEPAPFDYVYFETSRLSHWTLLHTLVLAPLSGLVLYLIIFGIKRWITASERPASRGFYTDNPFVITPATDQLRRVAYIQDLKTRLLATEVTSHSFAIAIIGKWGSGKTSFMNTLFDLLSREPDIIQMKFNPWAANGGENMTAMFFNDLSKVLARYDGALKKEIVSYARDLLQAIDPHGKEVIGALASIFADKRDMDEQFKLINRSIQRLGKKIVVYIDDVDRLDKREVLDVLRIVRNTGDFNNVFFIVGFDKTYVTASINDALVNNSEQYMEKIFQLEYYLPLSPDKLIYRDDLYRKLEAILDPEDRPRLKEIMDVQTGTFTQEIAPNFTAHLTSFRDVKRYLNVFLLNYDYIKNNIYLADYLSICILRLKYPEVYQLLYLEKDYYLTEYANTGQMPTATGRLSLVGESPATGEAQESLLAKELSDHSDIYAINKKDVSKIVQLVDNLFTSESGGLITFSRSLTNHHLSIVNVNCFDRYFDLSMDGKLDQKEFDETLKKSLQEIEEKLQVWNASRNVAADLQLKFENIEVMQLRDKETFEKVIRAIRYFANLSHREDDFSDINQFDINNFYQKLAGTREQGEGITAKFYLGDNESYKSFLKTLFFIAVPSGKESFMFEFAVKLLRHHADKFILTHAELKTTMKEAFLKFSRTAGVQFDAIFILYTQIIREYVDKSFQESHMKPVGEGIELTDEFRRLIIERWLPEFMVVGIFFNKPLGYQVSFWPATIFGSKVQFLQVLAERRGNPAVDEFLAFNDLLTNNANEFQVMFDFKHIKVKNAPET
jgi:hypothetical protein